MTRRRSAPAGEEATLAEGIRTAIRPPPAERRAAALRDIEAAAAEAGCATEWQELAARAPELAPFLASVFDASPFLREIAFVDFARLCALLASPPDRRMRELRERARGLWRSADMEALMAGLRRARGEAALLIALADLGGLWDIDAVTAALSAFAEAAVSAAADFLLAEAHRAGTIALPHPEDPGRGAGWILLGMGKFGAGELNYSSDVDLIVLYDPDLAPVLDRDEVADFFVRLTRRLVRILQERTGEGYVFRTDLRLRPDPGSTPLAVSTPAAFTYYEASGQNWERAAMIKAAPVAGDREAGEAFLHELAPFVWRKYLDFAALADIHAIKRQIHDHRGHGEIAVAGHNIKLGRGGIREIEFFVQTQQLIAGGRDTELRGRRTLDMLDALARKGWIGRRTAGELEAAYRELRAVEHRLQMIRDEQTHTLPETEEALLDIARLSGHRTVRSFSKALTGTMETVRDHYAQLFEAAPSLSSTLGSLVFTGDDEDPETVATLAGLGFRNPHEVSRTVRGWHFGRYPAMRSATARERLTELTPVLLEALATTDNADAAFNAFDRFLARLPAGVQLFSLLGSNPGLLRLLAVIMGTAPRLAEIVTRRPHVLDALLEPAFFGRVPDRRILAARLDETLSQAAGIEEVLDRARIFGKEQSFLIGARVLSGTIGARQAGFGYADLAELIVGELFEQVRREFERQHGRMKKGRVALIALGKLGGREMTAASDLDLILLYDFAEGAPGSDGERSLSGSQYFIRLAQRLIAAISAPTAEGSLYSVDFRLRPSGNAGPLATRLDAFERYQADEAWTWEHMALTRARAIAGDRSLVAEAGRTISEILRRRRDVAKIRRDVVEMRALLETEKRPEGPWDLKQAPGGLVDIEFIAQYLELVHAVDHPEILGVETERALAAATKVSLLAQEEAAILLPALGLYQRLTQVLRLCVDGPFEAATAPRGLLDLLARAGELPDFATLDAHLRTTETEVRAAFERIIGKAGPKRRA